jgi:heat shock protein HtpX
LSLTILVVLACIAIALVPRRSFRGRTYVLLGLLFLMFAQSAIFLMLNLTHPLPGAFFLRLDLTHTLPRPPPPPPVQSGLGLWSIFQTLFIVNSGVVAIGSLAAGLAALFFEFGKSRFDMSKSLPELRFEPAPIDVSDTVRRLAGVANVSPPEALLVDSGVPSAFTIRAGRKYSLAVSVGLLESLDPREVEACIAHEIAHLKNKDFRIRALATLGKLALFARPPSYLIEPAIYRAREFLADETAARMLGGAEALISALSKLVQSDTMRAGPLPKSLVTCNLAEPRRVRRFLGKHPSLESRIKILREMRWN